MGIDVLLGQQCLRLHKYHRRFMNLNLPLYTCDDIL